MRRLIASPVTRDALQARGIVPPGYVFAPAGFGYVPGTIQPGPYDNVTMTAYLLPGDDGEWLRGLALQSGGKCEGEEV